MEKLSVVIAAKNEERNIRACLESVKWADEIIIMDDLSSDRTAAIAREYTAKVFTNDTRGDFHINKNLGIEKASNEWILSLDADEIISGELAAEIRAAYSQNMLGYRLNRRNYFLGQWIKGCGWYPDRIIRLFRKGSARWYLGAEGVHKTPQIADKSRVGILRNDFLHYSYYSLGQYFEKFNHYTSLVAKEFDAKRVNISGLNFPIHFCLRPLLLFFKKYVLLSGWKDGMRGFFISLSSGLVEFVSLCKLWELRNNDKT